MFRFSERLITSSRIYDKPFPYFLMPQELGSFSIDEDGHFHHDRRQLKIFVPPEDLNCCNFDLKMRYEMAHEVEDPEDPDIPEHLEDHQQPLGCLLKWITLNKVCFKFPRKKTTPSLGSSSILPNEFMEQKVFKRLNIDFVCGRSMLTHLLSVPYEQNEDLAFCVIRFRGTYFLIEHLTLHKAYQVEHMTEHHINTSVWGFKFEQYVTADKESGIPKTDVPVDSAQFGSVVQTRLNSHSLVFCAEIDCEDANHIGHYIELKTSRLIETERQKKNFCRYKLMKWWIQSFLIGISKIICGFRDDNGVVRKLEEFPVADIPKQAMSVSKNVWKPNVCFNFLDKLLEFIKSTVTEDNERRLYMFHWKPGSDLVYETHEGDAYKFLPDFFLHWDAWDKPF